jgi:MoaA/NifB/PqqE/SkfB family radical SAM enzyme
VDRNTKIDSSPEISDKRSTSNPLFAWLEITGKCQLTCGHCYAESGPHGTNGVMTADDWANTIDQLAGLGTRMVQFIGGEPTLHKGLPDLVDRALGRGLEVEVFSNLVHVPARLWEVFERRGVRLATSYYSDNAEQHEKITKGRGSYPRTKANIAEALRRSIPVRVGVIDIEDGQRVDQARAELTSLGVSGEIRVDRLRQVGRGVRNEAPDLSQLCGKCGHDNLAIAADGSVWPCVFSRWLPVGNVREDALADILIGPRMTTTTAALDEHFAARPNMGLCDPKCGPNCGPACNPQCWPTGTGPCTPNGGCQPNYD